ncbi:filamentous hemagglutinin N-terminal domain-containing protein [filamentous cyanobacterium LEGE 11480]|uniref:Filamentous hemagglutinin N-terminal domain-containing protein n=1 Tax=Romeriopsis navalis LEGE 11480 TaxID=2777977 RepID=A0A928VP03_9CYAN|nr:filamentous hemagglutinin N-terminal domain-containing protein [Romeriopsis navalis]MBE9032128.1 filamentous hemagglutinin N-terminal domain-containing protein [Romeriopsis navalis LEGE 11480]
MKTAVQITAPFLLIALATPCPSVAQVIPDSSLGAERSIVTPQAAQDLITGGAIRGNSLFHSFQAFNVNPGETARFSPPSTTTNIFSRVTGNNISNIQGTLGVIGNANLFLLNPNGISFGPNAQLDLSGSFTATTASSFQFGPETFSTITPQSAPLLTISAPVRFNFGNNPGTIINRSTADGTGLTVKPFRSIAFLGGDIHLAGGQIIVSDAQIRLSSLGNIVLTDQSIVATNTVLGNPNSEIRLVGQAITLDGQSSLRSNNSSTNLGANITIEGQTLKLMDGSNIASATNSLGQGGNVTTTLSGNLTITSLAQNSQVSSSSFILAETSGPGIAGNVDLSARQLWLEYDSYISNKSRAFSTGNVGDITINASESIIGQFVSPRTRLGGFIGVETLGSGDSGTIKLTVPSIALKNHHVIFDNTWFTGNGGNIIIEANSILLDGVNPFIPDFSSSILSVAYGSGQGANIQVNAQNITVQNGASIITAVLANRDEIISRVSDVNSGLLPLFDLPESGFGNAGNVNIMADTILVDGFDPTAASRPSQISSISLGTGDAGNVGVRARELTLLQGGAVGSSSLFSFSAFGLPVATSGLGNGGSLTVNADTITVTGVNALTELPSFLGTQAGSLGNAGDTQINTRRLNIRDGGTVLSGTFTSGNGGTLTIDAQESVIVDGINANGQPSTIAAFASAPSELLQLAFFLPEAPKGNTGQLIINSDRLTLSNGGTLSAAHQGTGNAGALQVNVNQLRLSQGGQLSATSLLGQGGNVDLQVRDVLTLRQGSRITAAAFGPQGNGGNLAITAGIVLALPRENSDIIANAVGGNGGNINLRTGTLLGIDVQPQLTSQSDITASSQIGLAGTVKIDFLNTEPNPGLTILSISPLSPNDRISIVCNSLAASRFILSGRGGIPLDPRQQITSTTVLQDWRNRSHRPTQSSPQAQSPPISSAPIEAQSWHKNAQGQIELIAAPPIAIPAPPTCSNLSINPS